MICEWCERQFETRYKTQKYCGVVCYYKQRSIYMKLNNPMKNKDVAKKVSLLRKNKTYEEIYGIEKARLIKQKQKESQKEKHRKNPMSEETKRKIGLANSIALKGKKKKPFSKQHKENIRQANLGKKASDETRRKLSIAHIGKKRTKKSRMKQSKSSKRFWKSDEWLMSDRPKERNQKISEAVSLSYIEGRNKRCKTKYYYKNVCFRSSWEVKFVKILEKQKIKYEYEKYRFKLPNDRYYIPDFYLVDNDIYVEIKGYMTKEDEYKIKNFKKKHQLIVLDNMNDILSFNRMKILEQFGHKIEVKK